MIGSPGQILSGKAIEGDADEEESQLGDEDGYEEEDQLLGKKRFRDDHVDEMDEDEEPPLFPSGTAPTTPIPRHQTSSSSPIYPPSAMRDYSSELDKSSPVREWDTDEFGFKRSCDGEDPVQGGEGRRAKKTRLVRRENGERKDEKRERTRHYEVVGVVRKKVVFALR